MKFRDYDKQELMNQINTGSLSVLTKLGAKDLKDEMIATGKICSAMVDSISAFKGDCTQIRKRTAMLLKPFTPARLISPLPQYDGGIVIGFNHPSLGEIFRLMWLGIDAYPDREYLFPVNLPWYEAIVPLIPKLKKAGINVTPMITPSTEKKLRAKFENDKDKMDEILYLKTLFDGIYMRKAKAVISQGGIIFVAPSATRQATVFGDKILPTMTLLARKLLRNSETDVLFVPVAIVEPRRNNRKTNLLKYYEICPCEPFDTEQTRELALGGRTFDYEFLKRIDDIYKTRKKRK